MATRSTGSSRKPPQAGTSGRGATQKPSRELRSAAAAKTAARSTARSPSHPTRAVDPAASADALLAKHTAKWAALTVEASRYHTTPRMQSPSPPSGV